LIRIEARRQAQPLGAIFLGIGLATGLGVALLHLDRLPIPLCVLKATTGVPCVTCGATRALGHLFALDLGGALAMNPLAAVGALVLVAWGAADLVLLTRGRALTVTVSGRLARLSRMVAVTLLVANWVYLVAAGR